MKLNGARILITQAHLARFMGSEIVTLELAEFFSQSGADVVVVTHTFGGELREPFEALNSVRVFELPDPELEELWGSWMPDLAWIQHSLVPARVLENADRIRFIFHHLSAYLPIERPLNPELERALATVSTFISEEAKENQLASGLYEGFGDDRLQTFENPAPHRFQPVERDGRLSRLLIVSNHIPPELVDALPELRSRYEVVIVGSQREHGARPYLVDPELLAHADAVVAIGKTVQFAMGSGLPVYLYDHFGGPGWLTHENFATARRYGFSGRGFESKTTDQILGELANGWASAREEFRELVRDFGAEFRLSERMDKILRYADDHVRVVSRPEAAAIRTHANLLAAFGSYVREWVRMQGDAIIGYAAQRELELYRRMPGHRIVRRVLARQTPSRPS